MPPKPSTAPALRAAIFALFLASGAAGLIYEVLWTRLLTYVFGATLPAVSTVLAAFMGGLALGSLVLGPWADRLRRPLRLYAFLELGIAAGALAVPGLLGLLEPLNRAVFSQASTPFAALSLYRFAVNAAVLLLPTVLMGATLPVLSRFLVRRRESLGLNVGGLYAANTFGAVTGTALCGFLLIGAVGLRGTQYVAAALNFGVFLLALAVSRRVESGERPVEETLEAEEPASPGRQRLYRVALATYAVSGFVSLSLQVVWTRGLTFCADVLRSSTYSFSAMLTVFLSGLALGSAVMTARIDRQARPGRLYAMLLILLGLSGAFSGLLMFNLAPAIAPFQDALVPEDQYVPFGIAALDLFFKAILVMGLPTFIMGLTFPVAARLCVPDLRRVGGGVGRLYAFNTAGAILGAFAAGFVLIPLLGMSRTVLALAALNMLMGLAVFLADPDGRRAERIGAAMAVAAAVALFALRLPARDETFRNALPRRVKVLKFVEGPLATVAVTEDTLGYRSISIDNVEVAGTHRVMLTDQKSLAHLPALILEAPSSALTVGFGSGGASYSYTLYEEMRTVHCVEIAKTVLRPDVQRPLWKSNHYLLDRLDQTPQYGIVQADARSYLRFAPRSYDSIATDCTDLRYKTNANLYDLEYFRLCRQRLTEDGAVVVWMPLGGLSRDLFFVALRTFHRVFGDDMHVWYFNNDTVHYILLVGLNRPVQIDYARMASRLTRPEIAADLAEIDLVNPDRPAPDKILGCYVTGGTPLTKLLGQGRVNTENDPILEFEAPLSPYDETLIWSNLQALYSSRQSVLSLIDRESLPADAAERIQRFETAAPILARGLAAQSDGDYHEAATRFDEAWAICPDDPARPYLDRFPDARAAFVYSDEKAIAGYRLGSAAFARGDYEKALALLRYAVAIGPEAQGVVGTQAERKRAHFMSLVYSGQAHWRLGQREEAMGLLGQATRIAPADPALEAFRQEVEGAAKINHPSPTPDR
jgi:spermidine synthase